MSRPILLVVCAAAVLNAASARAGEAFVDQLSSLSVTRMIRVDLRQLAHRTVAAPTAVSAREASAAGPSSGIQNAAQLEQIGSHNSGVISQTGSRNSAVVVQHGSNNVAMVTQTSRAR